MTSSRPSRLWLSLTPGCSWLWKTTQSVKPLHLLAALPLLVSATSALANTVRIEDLNLSNIVQGWGTPHADHSVQGNPISIGGVTFTNGLGTHAVSDMLIQLDGQAQRFQAQVGVDDEMAGYLASIEFVVTGDGQVLYRSGIMYAGDAPKPVDVSLTNISSLLLEVTDGGDIYYYDHADWAEGVITYAGAMPQTTDPNSDYMPTNIYPLIGQRVPSPGHTIYYVSPVAGDDQNSGLQTNQAWRTLRPVNARRFAPGDRVEFLASGSFDETLMPLGDGDSNAPVEIHFATGDYDFYPANAVKIKYQISNANDDPNTPKAIAILFQGASHYRLTADGANIYVHGKMIETCFDHAQDIALSNVHFDYRRPTVSECTVLSVNSTSAVVQIHPDSAYAIQNQKLVWIGEGWRSWGTELTQELDPVTGFVWRSGNVLSSVTQAQELAPFQLRLSFSSNPGFTAGHVLQFRDGFRDCVGGFVLRSQNISWTNVAYFFMHGLGIVGQFSQDLSFEHCNFAPRPGSGRTCACWADCLHFSGCRGQITVANTTLSGTQDDPINVHGTYLRIISLPATNQVQVRFMHAQSYGFDAYVPGDQIFFTTAASLVTYATNTVQAVQVLDAYNVLLTLASLNPTNLVIGDAIENATWTPSVTIRNCQVSLSPTYGLVLKSRQPILVENCTFRGINMSPIGLAQYVDTYWYESCPVHQAVIRNNRFLSSQDTPVIVNPGNTVDAGPVNENIRIDGNYFGSFPSLAIMAKSVNGLTIISNRVSTATLPVQTSACIGVIITNNQFNATQ